MKLPNKYISFKKSSLSKFTIVLEQLKNNDLSILDLYIRLVKGRTNQIFENTDDFIETLDYLYALGKIQINEEGMIHYVSKNWMWQIYRPWQT